MGLSLVVGILADLDENDPEGAEVINGYFKEVNRFLSTQSLSAHHEPTRCEEWSCSMYGYSGVHYLRRVAAHLEFTGKLPSPEIDEPSRDPLVLRYYESFGQPARSWFRRKPRRSFDHLMIHSDAEGYYLPQDFSGVLVPPDDFKIPGGMIGSSVRLLTETESLAAALSLPLNLDLEGSEVGSAIDTRQTDGTGWRRYGIEAHTCLCLRRAAEHSLRTGAALVFS